MPQTDGSSTSLKVLMSSVEFHIGVLHRHMGLPLMHPEGGDDLYYEAGRAYVASGGPVPLTRMPAGTDVQEHLVGDMVKITRGKPLQLRMKASAHAILNALDILCPESEEKKKACLEHAEKMRDIIERYGPEVLED